MILYSASDPERGTELGRATLHSEIHSNWNSVASRG